MPINDIFKLPLMIFPRTFDLQNYFDVFTMVPFARYYANTIFIVVINIIGALISNICIAYAFARLEFRGKRIMFSLSICTLMLPASVQLIPLFLEWNWLGGINTFLPLTVPAFFGNAFFIFLLVQFFRSLPRDFDEAAFIDGANYPVIILKVIVPMSKPAIAVVAIFQFLFTWNDFLGPLIFLNDSSLYTLSIGLRSFITTFYTPWPALMAAATLTVLPLIILFFIAQKHFVAGLTMGGVKG
ncbi:carbohydrate ABC transporter permease [Marispirochaeta sp.]|uniref:carbohydrate ABC transporter permease n=1 Tax=Marispirochaeta sp. TaxID=2038653 RepID=UPI0029C956BD|nr:carbohydrate ABC transporter permease [Marispirochaeta sp.]